MDFNVRNSVPQPYQYLPLRDQHEIRLLKIEKSPCPDPDHYNFSLNHVNLEDKPAYETLSYVWGLDVRDRFLPLKHGFGLHINQNLETAILEIPQHCSTGYLWVDQICINQDNIRERNKQVKIMGQIYAAGFQVLVWLGPSIFDPCDVVSLDVACRFADESFAIGQPNEGSLQHLKDLLVDDVDLKNHELTVFRDYDGTTLWQLLHFFSCGWFSRCWVFQEVVLSARSKFILSSSTVSLSGLFWISKAMDDADELIANDYPYRTTGSKDISLMYNKWVERHHSSHISSPAVQRFDQFLSAVAPGMLASNPRDYVYAFLGLNDDPDIQIKPDYRLSMLNVFASVTIAIIQNTSRLDILELLCRPGYRYGTPPRLESPTWAIDFRLGQHVTPFSTSTATIQKSKLNHMYAHVGPVDLTRLVAHGKLIDRILSRLTPLLPPYFEGDTFDFDKFVRSAVSAWKASTQNHPKPTERRVFEALVAQGYCQSESGSPLFSELLIDKNLLEMLSKVVGIFGQELEVKRKRSRRKIHQQLKTRLKEAISAIAHVGSHRNLFITEHGRLALGSNLEAGDEICILHGCLNPVALRRAKRRGTHYVLETCFLEDWMDPWATNKVDWREDQATEFILL